jgi:hypothetical protein
VDDVPCAFHFEVAKKQQIRSFRQWLRDKKVIFNQTFREEAISRLVESSLDAQLWSTQQASCLTNLKRFNGNTTKAQDMIDDFVELIDRLTIIRNYYHEELELVRDMLNREVSSLANRRVEKMYRASC